MFCSFDLKSTGLIDSRQIDFFIFLGFVHICLARLSHLSLNQCWVNSLTYLKKLGVWTLNLLLFGYWVCLLENWLQCCWSFAACLRYYFIEVVRISWFRKGDDALLWSPLFRVVYILVLPNLCSMLVRWDWSFFLRYFLLIGWRCATLCLDSTSRKPWQTFEGEARGVANGTSN